jgi:hypothetical protein
MFGEEREEGKEEKKGSSLVGLGQMKLWATSPQR